MTCQICFEREGSLLNPMLTGLCNCINRAIHRDCLRDLSFNYLDFYKGISPNLIRTKISLIQCMQCKQKYDPQIKLDDKYCLDQIFNRRLQPKLPYLVLEVEHKASIQQQIRGWQMRFQYLVSFSSKQKFELGKNQECDIPILHDPYVSWLHAKIQFNSSNHEFYISDEKSKFGTLKEKGREGRAEINIGEQLQLRNYLIRLTTRPHLSIQKQ